MLALSFTFPAGRYHATPWERHVNEGAVAWPPEPWRLLRALVATWHHKVKHAAAHDEGTLQGLIESLATEAPEYRLPAASHSHTRHYMPQFATGKTSLIFDAFTAIRRDDPLTVVWPALVLSEAQTALLDDLLRVMGYLGRAESWVEAERIIEAPETNCKPGADALDIINSGEVKGELVTLYVPLPAEEYRILRQTFLPDAKAVKKLGGTLPEQLVDALSVETAELRKQGWNQPPAARKVGYLRPEDALKPKLAITWAKPPVATTASFVLDGRPSPRVEDSLRIGELMRIAVMSQAKHVFGEDRIPAIFSGHGLARDRQHGHAFYLPFDSNGDGRIDRILVHAPDGMDAEAQLVLHRIERLWERGGAEWRLHLEAIGASDVGGTMARGGVRWESATPYLHPWHAKRRFTVEDQIRRECRDRGLPDVVSLKSFDEVAVGGGIRRRSIQFRRFRSRRGINQPDRLGGFWRIEFAAPLRGPLALGFGCHFGLGLFRPAERSASGS